MSMTTRVAVRNATSPCSSPNPESMYCAKVPRKRSITATSFMAQALRSVAVEGHGLWRVWRAAALEAPPYFTGALGHGGLLGQLQGGSPILGNLKLLRLNA